MGGVVVVVVLVLFVVTGAKQSQLLDLSLGLGLEFDNIIFFATFCTNLCLFFENDAKGGPMDDGFLLFLV